MGEGVGEWLIVRASKNSNNNRLAHSLLLYSDSLRLMVMIATTDTDTDTDTDTHIYNTYQPL